MLCYDSAALELEITDVGTATAPGTGHGLIGMRVWSPVARCAMPEA